MYRRIPQLQCMLSPPYTVESHDYTPPLCMLYRIGQKWGGGLCVGALHFRVTTITNR